MGDGLRVERHGRVLVVTIDRQDRMNALSQEVSDGLRETWTSLADDRSVRAIVITGAGTRAFSTGMDLKAFAERGGPRPIKADVHAELCVTPLHCDVWLPTVVAVNGVCTGSGLHFVADADIVVASSTASFLDTHVSVGAGRRHRTDHAASADWPRKRPEAHGPRSPRAHLCRGGAADWPGRRSRRADRAQRPAPSSWLN